MYAFALDRIGSLTVRATAECREPTCGARDEDGNVVSCSSEHCGEKLMLPGWRRELAVMRDIKEMVEWLDRQDLKKKAAADKAMRDKR